MPVANNIGYSRHTSEKQSHLRQLLELHFKLHQAITRKHGYDETYYWFDLTAGNGQNPDGGDGSALIFQQEVLKAGIPYEAVLIEKEPENCDRLESIFANDPNTTIICGDHRKEFPKFFDDMTSLSFGFIYMDKNGVPDWELLRMAGLQRRFQKMDILANCPATAIKKSKRSLLVDLVKRIPKEYMLLRDPLGQWQFSLMIFTNWIDFPALKKINFHKLESDGGQAVFNILNKTCKELKREKPKIPKPPIFKPPMYSSNMSLFA